MPSNGQNSALSIQKTGEVSRGGAETQREELRIANCGMHLFRGSNASKWRVNSRFSCGRYSGGFVRKRIGRLVRGKCFETLPLTRSTEVSQRRLFSSRARKPRT